MGPAHSGSLRAFLVDALIVSAAQVADCRYLLTEDLQDAQIFGNLQVINPFHTAPETREF
jgi:predicted nucleic acid-binding protein